MEAVEIAILFGLQIMFGVFFRILIEKAIFYVHKQQTNIEATTLVVKIPLLFYAIIIPMILLNQPIYALPYLIIIILFIIGMIFISDNRNRSLENRLLFIFIGILYYPLSLFLNWGIIPPNKAVIFPLMIFSFMGLFGSYLSVVPQILKVDINLKSVKTAFVSFRTLLEIVLISVFCAILFLDISLVIFWSSLIFLALGLLGFGFLYGTVKDISTVVIPKLDFGIYTLSIISILLINSLGFNTLTTDDVFFSAFFGLIMQTYLLQHAKLILSSRSFDPIEMFRIDSEISKMLPKVKASLQSLPPEIQERNELNDSLTELAVKWSKAPAGQYAKLRLSKIEIILKELQTLSQKISQLRQKNLASTLTPTYTYIQNKIIKLTTRFQKHNITKSPLIEIQTKVDKIIAKTKSVKTKEQLENLATEQENALQNSISIILDYEFAIDQILHRKDELTHLNDRAQKLQRDLCNVIKLGFDMEEGQKAIRDVIEKIKNFNAVKFDSPQQCLVEITEIIECVKITIDSTDKILSNILEKYKVLQNPFGEVWIPKKVDTNKSQNMLILIDKTSSSIKGEVKISTELIKTNKNQPVNFEVPASKEFHMVAGLWGERGGKGKVSIELSTVSATQLIGPVNVRIPFSQSEWVAQTTITFAVSAAIISLIGISLGFEIQFAAQIGSGMAAIIATGLAFFRRFRS